MSVERLIDNALVRVTRHRIEAATDVFGRLPRERTLVVFVRGGRLLSGTSGRHVHWPDGRTLWRESLPSVDREAPWQVAPESSLHLVCVEVKRPPAGAPAAREPGAVPLHYPNVAGEDVFENELLLVQRFVVPAGTWEGIHGHGRHTLYVHVTGGKWAVRAHGEPEHVYAEPSLPGETAWMDEIEASTGHESGNVGDEPIDLFWITVKTAGIAPGA